MNNIENMAVKTLYRNILKGLKKYPSVNRKALKEAIKLDFRDGKALKSPLEIAKAIRKARMGYSHILMYQMKMEELNGPSFSVDKRVELKSFALAKGDPEFVYF